MVIHAKHDSTLCQIFPSSLKGIASDWFYSLPPRSVHCFRNLTKLFLAQYSSRQEFEQNNHHLLFIKMRPSDSLKAYIIYFQNQLVKVHNCSEDASSLAFISRLQISHLLYKHLVKYNFTHLSEVLYQAQPYIQLEEAMKDSANPSPTVVMREHYINNQFRMHYRIICDQ